MKLDYFLYSCFEFEETVKATPIRSTGSERWPRAIDYIEGENTSFDDLGNLDAQMRACFEWYTEKFPNLMTERNLDLTNINGIIPAVVFLGLDLKFIIAANNEFERLVFSETKPQPSLWNRIEDNLKGEIKNFSRHIVAYLQWAYAEKEEKQWDIGSRPPIGRYAPRPKRSSGGPSSGNRDRKPSGGGNHRGGNRSDHKRGGNAGKRGGDKRSRGNNQQLEKQALTEVNDAVKKMSQDDSVNEVKLPPANSFFRRLQHKHAIAQGFESSSQGEGHDRSVVVKRAKDD